MAMDATTSTSRMERSMGARMRRGPRQRAPYIGDSRKVRVAKALDVSTATAEKRLYGREAVNLQCAQIVTADVQAGDLESAVAFVTVIEAALAGTSLPLLQSLHEAELADNLEQIAEEAFRHAIQEGRATIEQAREYIRKSAVARRKAEQAEQSVQRWIDEHEAGR